MIEPQFTDQPVKTDKTSRFFDQLLSKFYNQPFSSSDIAMMFNLKAAEGYQINSIRQREYGKD